MEFQVNFGCWGQVFAVPTAVADHFLKLATELQLKVLLYLLRTPSASAAGLAAYFRVSEEQIEEAVQFWVQANILQAGQTAVPQETGTSPMGSFAVNQTTPPAAAPAAEAPKASVQRCSKEIKLDPSEIAQALERSGELKDLFYCAEKTFGRFLNHMEQRSLIWMHSYLGIRSDVLLTLLSYCAQIEKLNMSYAESIAIRWQEEEILTLEQAEAEIKRLTAERNYTTTIQRMFDMKRRPTSRQMEFLEQWKAAGYAMELIQYAYEITIESIDKLNFKYINTILESWASKGITTLEDAKQTRKSGGGTAAGGQSDAEMDEYLSMVNRFLEE